jgi:hypothetical protein
MKYIGNVQAEANSEVFAVASGALPDGKPVIVNSDGTVSVISAISQSLGATVDITQESAEQISAGFDTNSNRVLFAYRDGNNSGKGTAIVGTVNAANQTISFGTAVVFFDANNFSNAETAVTFDTSVNKFVIFYIPSSSGGDRRGRAKVATVDSSDNSVTFGSEATYHDAITAWCGACFDSNSNKHVVGWSDGNDSDKGYVAVGTISGTDISFGSDVKFDDSGEASLISLVFDSSNNKVVVAYRDNGNSLYGTAIVGTVSGTSISFGTAVVYNSASTNDHDPIFDTNANKVVIFFKDGGDSDHGHGIVGTVSGTSISFGTKVEFEGATTQFIKATFDNSANKTVVSYQDGGNSNNLTFAVGTVSGTSISFATPVASSTVIAGGNQNAITFDSNAKQVVTCFKNDGSGDDFGYMLFQNAGTSLTTENFLGFSTGFASPAVAGSATTFELGKTQDTDIAYIGSNKVVIAYQQHYNTSGSQTKDGYCIVGTISGTSISFGTATAFSTGGVDYVHVANVENDKVVVFFQEGDNSNYATARVGTVSGTGISFGTAVVANSGNSAYTNIEGIGNDKVVGVYRDDGDSDKGKAIVGTVSGTSISFGSEVEFNTSGDGYDLASIGSSKVVIAYKDVGNSGHGTAIVGTVSGTSISFGSEVVYEAATTGNIDTGIAYIGSDKVVISYQDEGNSSNGTAIVGTVSGTSISFGTAAVFEAAATSITNSTSIGGDKVVIVYSQGTDAGQGNGKYAVGTVSGTGISFDTAVTFNAAPSWDMAVVSPEDNKVAISWGQHYDTSGSRLGQALVTTIEDRGSLASGKTATIQVGGAISTIQGGLTAGQQYFVQTDGTIGTTAATPSVIAGTAVSATDLIVKG